MLGGVVKKSHRNGRRRTNHPLLVQSVSYIDKPLSEGYYRALKGFSVIYHHYRGMFAVQARQSPVSTAYS